jgi:hypothetical protein
MEPQVGVGHVGRRLVEHDDDVHDLPGDAAVLVLDGEPLQVDSIRGSGRAVQGRCGVPGVQHLSGCMHRRQADSGPGSCTALGHDASLPDVV